MQRKRTADCWNQLCLLIQSVQPRMQPLRGHVAASVPVVVDLAESVESRGGTRQLEFEAAVPPTSTGGCHHSYQYPKAPSPRQRTHAHPSFTCNPIGAANTGHWNRDVTSHARPELLARGQQQVTTSCNNNPRFPRIPPLLKSTNH